MFFSLKIEYEDFPLPPLFLEGGGAPSTAVAVALRTTFPRKDAG